MEPSPWRRPGASTTEPRLTPSNICMNHISHPPQIHKKVTSPPKTPLISISKDGKIIYVVEMIVSEPIFSNPLYTIHPGRE